MTIISIANQKGGCAKTTSVVNLAACLAELNYKVLVIDMDPQGNSSQWLGVSTRIGGVINIFTQHDKIDSLIQTSSMNGVYVISASQDLAQIEKILAGELAIETLLKRRLKKQLDSNFDFILIDTPPTLGLLTLNALVASSKLIVPVTTHVMTLSGVAQLMATVTNVQDLINPSLTILGFIASRVDMRTKHALEVLNALKERFHEQVFNTIIRENIRLAEAPSFSQSILQYDKNSASASDYRALTKEILARLSVQP
jgi:chromosome partitioning protein